MTEIWGEAVRSIEGRVKPANRDQWLRLIECLGISEGRIHLRAPNRFHKEWFQDNFLPAILANLQERERQTFAVEFEVAEEPSMPVPSQDVASESVVEREQEELNPANTVSRIANGFCNFSWGLYIEKQSNCTGNETYGRTYYNCQLDAPQSYNVGRMRISGFHAEVYAIPSASGYLYCDTDLGSAEVN